MNQTDKLSRMIDQAREVPIDDQQQPMELAILQALAAAANSDLSDLKHEILGLDKAVFFFDDHRKFFAAVKDLEADGSHIDRLTVGEHLDGADVAAFFDADGFDEGQIRTYLKTITGRATIRLLHAIGRDFLSAVGKADPGDAPTILAKMQKEVFDAEHLSRIMQPVKTEAQLLDGTLINIRAPRPGRATGFENLDRVLSGGFRPGLVVIAGTPGAGKTTYVNQLAAQMAAAGAPVLFFSYEQSAEELRLKTLSRLSRVNNEFLKTGDIGQQWPHLERAVEDYRYFGDRMKIVECDSRYTISTIRMMALQEQARMDQPPAIVIDYLQILPTGDLSPADKRLQIDALMSELRRLARDLDTTVIAVSAMSRASYEHAALDSFKESGGIEYTADVAAILKVEDGDVPATRTVTLRIVKNRNGRRAGIRMNYETIFDSFKEESESPISYGQALGKSE